MPFSRSERLNRLPPYLFAELERKKGELERQGKNVINLGIGDPDQPPPELALKTLTKLLYEESIHQYSTTQGTGTFRRAVVSWMKRRYNVTLDAQKEITLAVGSKELVAHLPLALTNPGDVVLLPEPGYPPYRSGAIFALAEPYVMPLKKENGFLPDLKAIPDSVAKGARILFINYPNNPTGAVASREFYKQVIEFAKRYNLVVVSDEAYGELYFDDNDKPLSFLEVEGAKEVGVAVHSMTKTFNMAGWRIAWACGNAHIVETLRRLKANLDSGQFMALQNAVAMVLNEGEKERVAIRQMYLQRREVLVNGLRKLGWEIPASRATFYVWFPVPLKNTSSMAFADWLLQKANVVVTPGIGFGKAGEGFVRIALTVPSARLEEAVRRIATCKP